MKNQLWRRWMAVCVGLTAFCAVPPVSADEVLNSARVYRCSGVLVSRDQDFLGVRVKEMGQDRQLNVALTPGTLLGDYEVGQSLALEFRSDGTRYVLVRAENANSLAGQGEAVEVAQAPVETPKAEAPKAEAPKAEAPKAEAPKAEAPKTEPPKPEPPKPEPPKPEPPKSEPLKSLPPAAPNNSTVPVDPNRPDSDEEDRNSPHIVNIEVEGNLHIPTDEILQVVSTRIGDLMLKPRMTRDAQAIYDLGYFTDVKLDVRMAPGGARLVFRVFENPTVDSITFSGNKVATSEKLASLMETKTGKILNTRTLFADLQNIVKYYDEDLGYKLGNLHIEDMNFDKGNLAIKLKDGMVIQKVEVIGVTVFPMSQVKALVRAKPGELFNKKQIDEDGSAVSKLYENNDYILENIRPTLDLDKGLVTLKVQEAVLQEIRVEGNLRTTTDTILRNMRTKPGQVLQKKRLQNDFKRLQQLQFFKKVDPNFEPGTEPGKQILVLDVEEQKTGLATIGLGYAGGGTGAIRPGVTGAVSLSDRNLFGQGKSASVQVQAGAQVRSVGINLLDPAINENQDSLGASVYYNYIVGLRENVTDAKGNPNFAYYDDNRIGQSITYGHPFMDELRGFVTLRHENLNLTQNYDYGTGVTPVGIGQGSLNVLGLSAVYDTRDDLFNPHVGSFLNGSVGMAGFGGTYNYNKFTVEARKYIPLSERQTIALRGWAGILTNGNSAPISEYFFAGGTDTMRGYPQNQFYGTNFVVLNAEYRFPIGNIKFLNGSIFGDLGNAWTPGIDPSKLFFDGGIGLRIVFPSLGLGVIRLDYAFGEMGGRASIGIGQSF